MQKAILKNKDFELDNTQVFFNEETNSFTVDLFGNQIAEFDGKASLLYLDTCGWSSRTTVMRMNGILDAFGANYFVRIRNGATEFVRKDKKYGEKVVANVSYTIPLKYKDLKKC